MKKFVTMIIICLTAQWLYGSVNEEFRGTWVITWEYLNPGISTEANMTRIRTIMDNHQKANMNALLWQVRQSGTAYYQSTYEPWGSQVGYKYPGYDPLGYAIAQAHQRGMELHAWFNVFRSDDIVEGSPAAEHPEWICRDRDGNPMTANRTLSPGLEEVREYLVKVVMEIVRNYDIDGLHLDYVRWSEFENSVESQQFAKKASDEKWLDGMISEQQLIQLETNAAGRYLYDEKHPYSAGVPEGFGSWEDWWRRSVTEFVSALHDSIQAVKPWVRLSAAALGNYNWGGWNGYYTVYQDAALWFNQGYIDQLTPMHYHWTTGSGFLSMLSQGCPSCWKQFIQKGINDKRLYTVGPGSYQFATQNVWGRHPGVVEAVRTVNWVDGVHFFSCGSWDDYQYWEEAGRTFFNRKTKIRATGLIDNIPPEAPTIELNKLDSLNYRIEVNPPASIVENQWSAIYRSMDDVLDVSADEIIHIHFGTTDYSYIDRFSGNQDYSGSYFYYATMFDRFWNESGISNSMESDPIFSAAPLVNATHPAEGDTITVNASILIEFSKKMDPASFQGSVSFSPDIIIAKMTWADDEKSVVIQPEVYFQFATPYTLTLSPSVMDANGKTLDGNGDGIGGDAFILHFRTQDQDVSGPVVIANHPDYQGQTYSFAIDEVVTAVFDEIVDGTTVNANSLSLKQGDKIIDFHHVLTTVDEKSILSLQSLAPLESDTEYAVKLSNAICDTFENCMDSDMSYTFRTLPVTYAEQRAIDQFLSVASWERPDYSGSTVGIVAQNTSFTVSTAAYLPASPTRQRISAALAYEWNPSATEFLLREYLTDGTSPKSVEFDTSYTVQVFLFGDGSGNRFRFCVDEGSASAWPYHEVSQWVTVDWYGWRLVEWKLNDPNGVGSWIGNSALDGTRYRIESIQLTHVPGAAMRGTMYFDNLRLVKKQAKFIDVEESHPTIAHSFQLMQNYPNPFNPETTISFQLPGSGQVRLNVYDIMGREVRTLLEGELPQGFHQARFNASTLSSGTYFYMLEFNGQKAWRKMVLMQ